VWARSGTVSTRQPCLSWTASTRLDTRRNPKRFASAVGGPHRTHITSDLQDRGVPGQGRTPSVGATKRNAHHRYAPSRPGAFALTQCSGKWRPDAPDRTSSEHMSRIQRDAQATSPVLLVFHSPSRTGASDSILNLGAELAWSLRPPARASRRGHALYEAR
jgi:hypothetical protein